jgi:hypothetical protein
MSRRIKTARGQMIDMAALSAKNERVRAVGNVLMNARGDRLNPDGSVKYSAEDIARMSQNTKTPPQQTAISDPKPITQTKLEPQEEQAIMEEFDPPAEPEAISKITKTREDGSQYMEIEYDDGSMETIELSNNEE